MSTVPQASACGPKEPVSPFQNKTNAVEFALARLDDLLNWGRKCK